MTNTLKEGIRRDFTSKGVIRSGVRRHRRGVVGRPPGWIITTKRILGKVKAENGEMVSEKPNEKEQARIDEADRILRLFWKKRRAIKPFRRAVTNCLTSGRGPLRLYIPPRGGKPGEAVELPTNLSIEQAIDCVFLLEAPPDQAAVVTDMITMRRAGFYKYIEGGKTFIEMCYINDAGKTVIRTLTQGDNQTAVASPMPQVPAPTLKERFKDWRASRKSEVAGSETANTPQPIELDLGGKLLTFEIENEALVTEQVRQNQKLIDKDLTMLSHNLDLSGFRERIYRNAQPPGTTVDDPTAPGGKRFIPADLPTGATARQFVQGTVITETDRGGTVRKSLSTPEVDIIDPVPVDTYEKTERIGVRNVLEDIDQVHVLISGDADVSGESRKQARDDYQKSLEESKSELDDVGGEVMEAYLAIIAILTGKPGRYADLEVAFNAQIDPGPISGQDRELNIKEKDANIRSTESAMEYIGISDPDAMKSKIIEEKTKLQGSVNDQDVGNGNIDPSGGNPIEKGALGAGGAI